VSSTKTHIYIYIYIYYPIKVFFLVQGVPGKKQSHKHMYKAKIVKPKQKTKKEIALANAQHSERTNPPSMVVEREVC